MGTILFSREPVRYNEGMKAVVQRVTSASVTIKETGEKRTIGPGLMVLLGVAPGDTAADVEWLAEKLVGLRVFEDTGGNQTITP